MLEEHDDHPHGCCRRQVGRRHNQVRNTWLHILQHAGWQAQLEQLVQIKLKPVAVKKADVIAVSMDGHSR
eukprot:2432684-Prorocentrum_lima.AAC.1